MLSAALQVRTWPCCIDPGSDVLLQIDKHKAKGAMKEIGIAKVGHHNMSRFSSGADVRL